MLFTTFRAILTFGVSQAFIINVSYDPKKGGSVKGVSITKGVGSFRKVKMIGYNSRIHRNAFMMKTVDHLVRFKVEGEWAVSKNTCVLMGYAN